MKKSVFFLFTLFTAIMLHAADPEFHGNILSALQEKNPRIRAGLMINTLENYPQYAGATAVLAVIKDDFANNGFDQTLFSRMITLLEKDPENQRLLIFCVETAEKYNTYPENLSKLLQNSLKKDVISKLFKERKDIIYSIIHAANANFLKKEDYRGSAEFFNGVIEKKDIPLPVIYGALFGNIHNCFHSINTAPGLPGYEKLPADDFWKSSLTTNLKKILSRTPANYTEARLIVASALLLQHPATPDLLKKYSKVYPDQEWTDLSASAAVKFNDRKLFIPHKYLLPNYKGLLTIRDFSGARRTIRQVPKKDNFQLLLMLRGAENNHREVIRLFTSANHTIDQLIPSAFHALINAVHLVKDRKLAEQMLNYTLAKINRREKIDPIICNAVGYVAADLNIRLNDAEKLIRIAVDAYPAESSFRDSLAWVLFRQKRFEEAEKEIALAVKNCNASLSSSVIFQHSAAIKHALKKNAEAKVFQTKAKQLYIPNAPECSEYDVELEKFLEKSLK